MKRLTAERIETIAKSRRDTIPYLWFPGECYRFLLGKKALQTRMIVR
jgi:hypothetical protein